MPRNHPSHRRILFLLLSSFYFIPGAFSTIHRALASAMGCIFSCFRFDHSNNSRSPEVRLNHDQKNPSTPTKEKGVEEPELNFEQLKDEAEFLKACGTILEIPAEIRKVVGEQNEHSSQKSAIGSLKFKSWLTSSSVEKLDLESLQDHSPSLAANCDVCTEDVGLLQHTPSSEGSSPNSTKVNELTKLLSSPNQSPTNPSLSTGDIAPSILKKLVRFNCEPGMPSVLAHSPSEMSSQTSDESGSIRSSTYRKPSPYPTPLKLVDEMETPGTIFPAYMDGIGQGKHPRIRSQFVHSAVHPVESLSQWKMLDGKDVHSDLLNNDTREPLAGTDGYGNSGTGEISGGEELNLEASLSPWLRGRHPSNQDASTVCQDHISEVGDTPILGLASAQYNGDESVSILPKWRAWNGIPNTTNKYKENQKVSWHATPFEERLEKALSEDAVISQRRQSNGCRQQLNL